MPLHDGQSLRKLLQEARTIAVVGYSDKAWRPSREIGLYLRAAGYTVYPVNPGLSEVDGLTCYPDVTALPVAVDIVNVFRRSEYVPEIVEQAIALGARALWLQIGVIHAEAARRAEEAGLVVVMDRCIKVDHARLVE